jgi:tryptophan-rich sensory protein
MKNRKIERYTTAAIVIGGIIGTWFLSRPRKGIVKTRLDRIQQKKIDRNLMTPANATFGIVWSVIYSGTLALAVHQALPSQLSNPRYQKAQWWFRINYLMTMVFGYFFSKSDKKSRIAAAVTTIGMLPAAIGLHSSLEIGENADLPEPEKTLGKFISIYAGWLTAASAVSATTLAHEFGYLRKTAENKQWTSALLPIAGGAGLLVSRQLNDPIALLPIAAALAGIAAKQKDKNKEISLLAAGLASSVAGLIINDLNKQPLLN